MKIGVLPKTKYGIWSVILLLLLILLVGYFFVMVTVFHQRGGATFFSNLNLTIPMLLAWTCGVGSLLLGLMAILKEKSRAVFVYIAVLVSFLTTLYGVLEIAFVH